MSELEKINDFHVAGCECDGAYISRPCGDARYHARQHFETGARQANIERLRAIEDRDDAQQACNRERNRAELLREDIECVHKWLDNRGAPREDSAYRLSIVSRIMRMPEWVNTNEHAKLREAVRQVGQIARHVAEGRMGQGESALVLGDMARSFDLAPTGPAQPLKSIAEPQEIHIVFDDGPGPVAGRFIEVETPDGKSVRVGSWRRRDDGNWVLIIQAVLPNADVHAVGCDQREADARGCYAPCSCGAVKEPNAAT